MRSTDMILKASAPLALLAALAAPLAAQVVPSQPPPQVVTNAIGESKVTPDRATVFIAVESRAKTAAEAAAENATTQTRVIAALRAQGLGADQITTVGYSVSPEYRYPREGGTPTVVNYVARNTVRAEIRRIDQVGKVIDASLGAGANRIAGVHFFASNQDEVRRAALTDAVAQACSDALAMARAAGGTIAEPIEITSHFMERPMMMDQMARVAAAAAGAAAPVTPIEPGEFTVRAQVMGRWRFTTEAGPANPCGVRR